MQPALLRFLCYVLRDANLSPRLLGFVIERRPVVDFAIGIGQKLCGVDSRQGPTLAVDISFHIRGVEQLDDFDLAERIVIGCNPGGSTR